MSVLQANCPSCGAPIEFKTGSTIVLVCPFCRSAVARTDRGLEDLGKVAEVADSQSPLKLGLKGTYNNARFELTGRAQLKHGELIICQCPFRKIPTSSGCSMKWS